ncbi:MAG: helix-turn-helix transcriptional regulator [Clostridia bacterium]|nr:helix-turn-helix transcriptional regulator [Clostridia bacterium]
MSLSMETIGRRLRAVREEKGYSREDIAQRLGISSNRLSRIETGKSSISLDVLVKLCSILQVSETKIILGTDVSPNLESNARFQKLAAECSEYTVEAMLQVCKRIAEIEKRHQ